MLDFAIGTAGDRPTFGLTLPLPPSREDGFWTLESAPRSVDHNTAELRARIKRANGLRSLRVIGLLSH